MKAEKFSAQRLRRFAAAMLIYSLMVLSIGVAPSAARAQQQEQQQTQKLFEKFARPDAATKAARDKKKTLWRVNLRSEAESRSASKYGTVVADYGSFVLLAADEKSSGLIQKFDAARVETTINLPSGEFEPVKSPTDAASAPKTVRPEEAARLAAADDSGEKGYYIVQFAGSAKDEWLESLREIGAEVLQYVPHQAFFVYADAAALAKITNHSRVRWVGRYGVEQKISPALEQFTEKLRAAAAANAETDAVNADVDARGTFDIAVFSRADLEDVSARIAGALPSVKILSASKLPNNFFNVLRVEMSSDKISEIAQIPDVVRIDPWLKPRKEDERAAQIVAGNYNSPTSIFSPGYNPLAQFGVNGAGVTVSVVDDGVSIPGAGGFYLTALNTVNGPLRGATTGASSGHGHINASIIAGDTPFGTLDPNGYNYGAGIAPKANIINIPFLKNGHSEIDAEAVDDTLTTLGANGVRGTISNNSWGDMTNGNAYDSLAAQYDGFVQDGSFAPTIDPITFVFSAGNDGLSGLTRPKVAKNIIAVGNSENLRTEIGGTAADNIDDLRGSSSRGPAADGRVKPDVTAPGSFVTGSRSGDGSGVGGAIDAHHSWSVGTSHAAPQVSGAAALFTQYWKNTRAGQYPAPSLIKAAIINSAQEMNGLITNTATIPNGSEGWGRVNMRYMFNTGVLMKYVNEDFAFVGRNVWIHRIRRRYDQTDARHAGLDRSAGGRRPGAG